METVPPSLPPPPPLPAGWVTPPPPPPLPEWQCMPPPPAPRPAPSHAAHFGTLGQLECMIAWNPNTDQIAVGLWPDRTRWSRHPVNLQRTTGACFGHYHKMTEFQRLMMLFVDFHTCVVRDKVPVEAAHKAFLAIREYRARISPDTLGAERSEGGVR